MTSSNGNIFRVTGPLCGEFTGPGEFPTQRPVTRSFDVFFDLRLNKQLNKQPWGWWFETPSLSLWRQCNVWEHKWHVQSRAFITHMAVLTLGQFTMPETCKNWHSLVNSCVYYARHTREIHLVLLYSMDVKLPGSFETHWVRQNLVNVVLFGT